MKLLVCCLFAAAALAQPPAGAPKPPRPEPKNLKILKPEQIQGTMRAFRGALGVECTHCHVQGDFANDEKPQKATARKMLEMTMAVNKHFPEDGKRHVTCYTCHRGAVAPLTAPAAQ